MRTIVVILALVGGVGCGMAGYRWWNDLHAKHDLIEFTRQQADNNPELRPQVAELDRRFWTTYLLFAGAALAVVGIALVLLDYARPAALALVVAGGAPLALALTVNESEFRTWALLAPVPLLLAGVLGLTIKPAAPAPVR